MGHAAGLASHPLHPVVPAHHNPPRSRAAPDKRHAERRRPGKQGPSERMGGHGHVVVSVSLNASWTKVELGFEPSPCTTAMIATEMPAATRPYSRAVAPDSSCTKRFKRLIIFLPPRFTTDALGSGGRYCPADPKPGRTLAGPTLQRG